MKFFILLLVAASLYPCEGNKNPRTATGTFPAPTATVPEADPDAASNTRDQPQTPAFPKTSATTVYSYQIILAENNTFGFEIRQDNRTLIQQTTIPGMPGNKGFTTKENAEKVAGLVIEKLKKGEMPPTISEVEMKQLGL